MAEVQAHMFEISEKLTGVTENAILPSGYQEISRDWVHGGRGGVLLITATLEL